MSEPQDQPRNETPPPVLTEREPPLTDKEIREVRDLLEADRRAKWFWDTTRKIAIWLGAVLAAFSLGWDWLVKLIKTAGS